MSKVWVIENVKMILKLGLKNFCKSHTHFPLNSTSSLSHQTKPSLSLSLSTFVFSLSLSKASKSMSQFTAAWC